MGRYTGPVCRLCRRENVKLMLKGSRCFSSKCAFDKRDYPPGMHGQKRTRGKTSDYGSQLREKQKARRIYGLSEKQFRRYVKQAMNMRGITGENIFQLIERRLDNIVYRLGFASSRTQARQIVSHGHILVNGKKVNIPSYNVKPGSEISIKEKSRSMPLIAGSLQQMESMGVPSWMSLSASEFSGQFNRYPNLGELALPVEPQLIVELYSR